MMKRYGFFALIFLAVTLGRVTNVRAQSIGSTLGYDGYDLSGYSETNGNPYSESEECVDPEVDEEGIWYCALGYYYLPWVSLYGYVNGAQDGSDIEDDYAVVFHDVSIPPTGYWNSSGAHYVGEYVYVLVCFDSLECYDYYDGYDILDGPIYSYSNTVTIQHLTSATYNVSSFYAPGSLAVSADNGIPVIDFIYTFNSGPEIEQDSWGNGQSSYVGINDTQYFGTYHLLKAKNHADGNWAWVTLSLPILVTVIQASPPLLHAPGLGAGDCGSVVRGGSITAVLENSAPLSNISWSFTAGPLGTAGQNPGNSTWAGTMAISGTIRVDFTPGGPKECTVTVTPRNWQMTAPPLLHPGGAPNGTYTTLPQPPPGPAGAHGQLGIFIHALDIGPGLSSQQTISSGPNTGFVFFTATPTLMADYQINPDLENPMSTFSLKQCGNYPQFGNGYISWTNLLAGTRRHEVDHPVASHYGQLGVMLQPQATNPGTYLEGKVWGPGGGPSYPTLMDWTSDIALDEIGIQNAIDQGVQSHAAVPPVNFTPNNTPLGNVNFPPYNVAPLC